MSLCYKQNLVFQLRAVRPSIAGYTAPIWKTYSPQLWEGKAWFSYDFLPILLIVPKYSIVESIRPMRHIYQ